MIPKHSGKYEIQVKSRLLENGSILTQVTLEKDGRKHVGGGMVQPSEVCMYRDTGEVMGISIYREVEEAVKALKKDAPSS